MQFGRTIFHVELKNPFLGLKDYYFGSLIAIYDILPTEVVGIHYKDLLRESPDTNCTLETSTAIIRKAIIIRHETNRGQGRRKQ